jgi:hypothetical protein
MLINTLLLAHIILVGYWLGSDLVINSTFRYVSRAAALPFEERDRLLDHVMDVDQHVRYAMILQLGLGTALAALLGYLPGAGALAAIAFVVAIAWLALVEFTHRLRKQPAGHLLARVDRMTRYIAILVAVSLATTGLAGYFYLADWLAFKFMLLAGAMLSGLGIRFALIRYFSVWHDIRIEGSTAARESLLRSRYTSATTVLIVLWLFIAGIVALSLFKP